MSSLPEFTLYTYFRSSAAFRVRIALNLKGIEADSRFVHLLRDGGEQHSGEYRTVNPQGLVPTLVHGGHAMGQSVAIIEYLDEIVPQPAFLPREPAARAWVRQFACTIACDIHPLNNLRVLQYLCHKLGTGDVLRADWQHHWITLGLTALEKQLRSRSSAGALCYGDTPTMADIFLIPQLANARRAQVDLEAFPYILRVEKTAFELPAFAAARPENQPDAE